MDDDPINPKIAYDIDAETWRIITEVDGIIYIHTTMDIDSIES